MTTEAGGAATAATTTQATTTTPEGMGTGAATAATTTTQAAPVTTGDWTSSLNDEVKGWVQNKGFTDPSSVIDSYRNFEKLMGVPKERLIKLPENFDDPNTMNEIYQKLGRPASADEYKIEIGNGDKELASWAKNTFHELGLTAKQAEALAAKWNGRLQGLTQSQADQAKTNYENETKALQKKWGAAYEQNSQIVEHAAQAFGLDEQSLVGLRNALGPSKAMELLYNIGSKIGESSFVIGNREPNSFVMTPDAAKNKIAMLRADPSFVKSYTGGDASAIQEMNRLHQMAYPS